MQQCSVPGGKAKIPLQPKSAAGGSAYYGQNAQIYITPSTGACHAVVHFGEPLRALYQASAHIVPLWLAWGSALFCFWKRKEKQETAKNFLLGGAAGGGRVLMFRRLIRQTMRRFSGRPSRTSSIPFSYSCRILNRFRKPIRIRMIQGDHQLLDLIFFGRSLYVFWQIIQPDFSQAHNTMVDPPDRLSITVAARTRQYGALRAIGMSGRQLTRMVAAEAVAYAAGGVCCWAARWGWRCTGFCIPAWSRVPLAFPGRSPGRNWRSSPGSSC